MKIIWNENPLATVVQLDDSDRQTLRAKLKADEPGIDDLDEQAAMYEAELARSHGGDCTCFPASCPKCYAESLLGLDTIAGLDKHEGAAIAYAFHPLEGGAPNLAEVLESLRDHKPVKGPSWKRFSDDVFQKHVPRWKEARRAYAWLVAYLDQHRDELSINPGGMRYGARMNVTDLDEAEGLTAEMVREWLARKGYAETQSAGIWQKRETRCIRQINAAEMRRSVQLLATWDNVSPQAILREMNPRMRKGLPGEADRAAHPGRWIASRCDEYTHTTVIRFVAGMTKVLLQFEDNRPTYAPEDWSIWSFWPCDTHGNKVRWPVPAPR